MAVFSNQQHWHSQWHTSDGNMIAVPAGWFTVFFPEDGHKPCAAVNDRPSPVRKVVVKIAVGS
jgi:YhcH/YjgK/YiaL family protein